MIRYAMVVALVATAAGADPAPRLSVRALEPVKGDADGGTYCRITGSRFIADGPRSAKVYFGQRQGTIVRFASDTELIVEAPGGSAGATVDVLVIFEPGGEVMMPHAFTFVAHDAPRAITPRAQLPKVIQPLLPKHGIYAAGGGLTSTPWRVVVDADAAIVRAGTSAKSNAPSYGPLDKQASVPIARADLASLIALGEAAWREPPPTTPPSPTADYDEILIVVDGDDAFYLDGFGPIRRDAAAAVIKAVRAAGKL
jgi:IPT/TIG domain